MTMNNNKLVAENYMKQLELNNDDTTTQDTTDGSDS